MNREDVIRMFMEKQNLKVSDVARLSNIPYSTIKSLMENGVEKTSYSNVCAICSAIGITPDLLEQYVTSQNNEEPQTIAAHFEGDEFTEDELDKIREFAAFVKSNRK